MTTTEADQRRAIQAAEERLSSAVDKLATAQAAAQDALHILTRAAVGRSWLGDGGTVAVCMAVEEYEGTLADLLAVLDAPSPHTLTDAETEALSAVVAPLLALLEARRG